jgi:hypothetical protein
MKSKVTQAFIKCSASGHYETDEAFDHELLNKFLHYTPNVKNMVFYTWLEWRNDYKEEGWLSRVSQPGSSSSSSSETTPKKKNKKNALEAIVESLKDPPAIPSEESLYYETVTKKAQNEMIANAWQNQDLQKMSKHI